VQKTTYALSIGGVQALAISGDKDPRRLPHRALTGVHPMLPRLDGYDWQAFTEQEEQAAEVPELLRRFLLGRPGPARRAFDDVCFVLAADDGYVVCPGLFDTAATAVIESLDELAPPARRRAAKLLNYVAYDLWLNIYGEPGEGVVRVVKDRAAAVSTLLADDDPVTARLAARLFCIIRLRSARGVGRLMTLYGREVDPWVRVKLVGFLEHLGGRRSRSCSTRCS
jgi:hypothetical protein